MEQADSELVRREIERHVQSIKSALHDEHLDAADTLCVMGWLLELVNILLPAFIGEIAKAEKEAGRSSGGKGGL